MVQFSRFEVAKPLVLSKPVIEHFKFFIREVLSYFGIDRNGWRNNRRHYHSPTAKKAQYLLESRLPEYLIEEYTRESATVLED